MAVDLKSDGPSWASLALSEGLNGGGGGIGGADQPGRGVEGKEFIGKVGGGKGGEGSGGIEGGEGGEECGRLAAAGDPTRLVAEEGGRGGPRVAAWPGHGEGGERGGAGI
ncbi:uncharacterized protein A4U43_C01F12790 [Asparagus officinalis]|uniref:Uncharacterized protein n=1 Tax=Asparagus officinalis TaxID=4686 RepID=A0A5P1FP49_ASPOF|nr:uncharacterized protein A4U43_C01F12790 [Asparagus officinalis]